MILWGLLVLLLPVQLGKHWWPGWSYVLGLRVDYLSPTIYLTDVIILLILGLWSLKKPKLKIKHLTFNILVFGILITNCLVAKNQPVAFYKLIKIIEFSLLGLYISKNRYSRLAINYSLIIAVVYSSLIAITQFLKQSSLNGIFWFLGERTFNAGTPGIAKVLIDGRELLRPYATLPHPNALAGFLLVGLILTLPTIRNRLFAINYLLLTISALFLTFSRSTWLVGLLVLFVYLLQKKKYLFAIYDSLLTISLLLFLPHLSGSETIFQRLDLTKLSWQLFRQSPFIGIGLNNFLIYTKDIIQPVHNLYLLILSETGLIGLILFLFFILITIKRLTINDSRFTALVAILATGLVDHYWLTLQQTQLLFTLVLGLSWSDNKSR